MGRMTTLALLFLLASPAATAIDPMPVVGDEPLRSAAAIRARLPETQVLILTTSGSADHIQRALDAGALGVALKSSSNASLVPAISQVAAGEPSIALRKNLLKD